MTRHSIAEYVEAVVPRYLRASKERKGKILEEFTQVTGLHRKAAIRLLNKPKQAGSKRNRGRPKKYGLETAAILKTIWEASDRLCSKRLHPFLPEMVKVLRNNGERITLNMENQICRMSASTIDRLLRPYRKAGGRKPVTTTRPGSILKNCIPIRTYADWQADKPGFMEIDLVAHCGDNTEGFYLNTLCAVDVATGWTECRPVWGKWQEKVKQSVNDIKRHLPFSLLGIDSDNGSEFINKCFFDYCRGEEITFTRSRAWKKNDSCYVEQKNGNVVRRLVGYDRYATKAAFECLGRIYALVRMYVNFFQPTMKLVNKTRHGAKVHKVYDIARTPYRRLIESGVITAKNQEELASIYQGLSPVYLLKQINDNIEKLWRLADRPVR